MDIKILLVPCTICILTRVPMQCNPTSQKLWPNTVVNGNNENDATLS